MTLSAHLWLMNPESKRRDGGGVPRVLGGKGLASRPTEMPAPRGRAGARSGRDPGSRAGLLGSFPKPACRNTQSTVECCAAVERSGLLMEAAEWTDLGNVGNGISQTQKDKTTGGSLPRALRTN